MRNWQAKVRQHWTHWIEIGLTAAIVAVAVAVGAAQIHIYKQQANIMSTQARIAQKQADIMNSQADIAQRQFDEIAAEQRPWVRPTNLAASEDLTVANGKMSFAISYSFVNSGKIPASDVDYAVDLFPGGKMLTRDQEFSCKEAEIGTKSRFLKIIFPNENGSWNFGSSWQHEDALRAAQMSRRRRGLLERNPASP